MGHLRQTPRRFYTPAECERGKRTNRSCWQPERTANQMSVAPGVGNSSGPRSSRLLVGRDDDPSTVHILPLALLACNGQSVGESPLWPKAERQGPSPNPVDVVALRLITPDKRESLRKSSGLH